MESAAPMKFKNFHRRDIRLRKGSDATGRGRREKIYYHFFLIEMPAAMSSSLICLIVNLPV